MFIKLEDALVIVLELARRNTPLDERQLEACRVVEDHIVNGYSDE